MDEATGTGGEAAALDATTGMEGLPPLWVSTMGCGEWSLPWSRPWGGRRVVVMDQVVGRGGEAATVHTAGGDGGVDSAVDVGNWLWGVVAAVG